MTKIKIHKKPFKGLKFFFLSIAFVAIGIWMIRIEQFGTTNYIMGWLGTCFFGLGIPLGLYQTFDRRPQIIITENGIWDRTTKEDEIKWEQIKAAYSLGLYKQKYVALIVDDTFVPKRKLYKWAVIINQGVGAQKVNLLVSQLNIDEETMANFINDMINTERENRENVIGKYFEN